MRRFALLSAAGGLAMVLCAWVEGALGPSYGGRLVVGAGDLVAALDPDVPASALHSMVLGLVHETLVMIGPDGLPAPALAEGWSTAASAKEWTLTIRRGATFHDGQPVTASDVARSLDRFLRGGSAAARRLASTLAQDATAIDASDDRHVVLRLARAVPQPLSPLTSLGAAITGRSGAGCGPFKPIHLVPSHRLGLTVFADHVRGRPFLDGIDIVAIPDRPALLAEFQSGHVDLIPGQGNIASLASSLVLILDPATPPFASEALRSGVASAINRSDLVRHFLPGGVPGLSLLPRNLLPVPDETASPRPPPTLFGAVSLVVSREVPIPVSQRVVASLHALGMQVTVVPSNAREALTDRSHARLLLFLPEVAEAGLALQELAALAPPVREAQNDLEAAAFEPDPDRRRGLLLRAEAALRNTHTFIGLAAAPIQYAGRRGVHGARVAVDGRLVLEDCWVEP